MLPISWLHQAVDRLSNRVINTPLTYDAANDVIIKWESYQHTGSFKVRGALNRILSLESWELDRGVVTASAGNHGLGLAYGAQAVKIPATVFIPENASKFKIDRILSYGAQIKRIPGGYENSERAGKLFAASSGTTWISAYNDGFVIAGQSTIVPEIISQLPDTQEMVWVVPVGGGGLISGLALYLHQLNPNCRIIGVQAQASPFFHAVYKQGTQVGVVDQPTHAEGLAGPIEENSATIPITRSFVEDIVLVTEIELIRAMAYAWEIYGEPIEPSGAAALAAILSKKINSHPAVVIVSGGNIAEDHFNQIIQSSRIKVLS
jgi:threonine dehydratase